MQSAQCKAQEHGPNTDESGRRIQVERHGIQWDSTALNRENDARLPVVVAHQQQVVTNGDDTTGNGGASNAADQ